MLQTMGQARPGGEAINSCDAMCVLGVCNADFDEDGLPETEVEGPFMLTNTLPDSGRSIAVSPKNRKVKYLNFGRETLLCNLFGTS